MSNRMVDRLNIAQVLFVDFNSNTIERHDPLCSQSEIFLGRPLINKFSLRQLSLMCPNIGTLNIRGGYTFQGHMEADVKRVKCEPKDFCATSSLLFVNLKLKNLSLTQEMFTQCCRQFNYVKFHKFIVLANLPQGDFEDDDGRRKP